MAQLIYNIPNNKVDSISADWIYLYPNKEREVRDGINIADIPEDASRSDDEWYQDKYTDSQWLKESIKRWANDQLKRSRQKQARDAINPATQGEIE